MLLFTADVYPYVYIYMHPWKGKVAAWCCSLARLTCCRISQHVLKIDGCCQPHCWAAGWIQPVLNVIFHNPNQRYVIGINQYSYRTWEKPCPAMWRATPSESYATSRSLASLRRDSSTMWSWIVRNPEVETAGRGALHGRPPSFFGRGPVVYLVLSPGPEKIQDVTKSNHIHMVDFRTKKTAQLSSVHHKSFQKLKGNPSYPTNQPETNWTKIQQEKPSQLSWGPLRSRSLWLGAAAWGLEASHH